MKRFAMVCVAVLLAFDTTQEAAACLWDYDTLLMERRQFPGTLELITGKFLRHSPEYYRWRIADRLERLKSDPESLSLYDDLAVAYEKTGETKKAIETILAKDRKRPGLYETHANLGTFYIHSGEFEKGLQEIRRAIKLNPKAHFGREVYQVLLVEYVTLARKNGKTQLPLSKHVPRDSGQSFYKFVLRARKTGDKPAAIKRETAAAIKVTSQ